VSLHCTQQQLSRCARERRKCWKCKKKKKHLILMDIADNCQLRLKVEFFKWAVIKFGFSVNEEDN
jgi:hypothetical protein